MAKISQVMLLGAINRPPQIAKKNDQYIYAMVYVTVVRGNRKIGDKVKYMRSDNPILMTWDPDQIREIETWQVNDIVDVKGIVASRSILKSSFCTHCNTKNRYPDIIRTNIMSSGPYAGILPAGRPATVLCIPSIRLPSTASTGSRLILPRLNPIIHG